MRTIRIFQKTLFQPDSTLELSSEAAHHVATVLRMQEGQSLQLFNGSNEQCTATICKIIKKSVSVRVHEVEFYSRESPLELHLGQAVAKGERMEWLIQKSVELGVKSITPLLTDHCVVKLDEKRLEKKTAQWQAIAMAACEQCGRNYLPRIHPPASLQEFLQKQPDVLQKLLLDPQSSISLGTLDLLCVPTLLLIGPEGGFSAEEIAFCQRNACTGVQLGPRVLRTETAAIVSQSLLQARLGDL